MIQATLLFPDARSLSNFIVTQQVNLSQMTVLGERLTVVTHGRLLQLACKNYGAVVMHVSTSCKIFIPPVLLRRNSFCLN